MKRLVTLLLAAALTVTLCACTNPLKAASKATESAIENTTTTSVVLDDPSVLPTFVIYDANDNTQIALTLNPVYADWHYLDADNTEQTITSGDATQTESTTSEITEDTDAEVTDDTDAEATDDTNAETTEDTGTESSEDASVSSSDDTSSENASSSSGDASSGNSSSGKKNKKKNSSSDSSSSGDASTGTTTSDQTAEAATNTAVVTVAYTAVETTAGAAVYKSADTASGIIVSISEDTTTDATADTTTDTTADTAASDATASSSGDASDVFADYAEAIVAASYLSLPTLDVDDDSEIYYNVEPAATPDRMEQTSWKAEYIGSESADAMEIYTKLANFYTLPLKADRVYQVTVIFDEENFESVGYYGTLTYMFITD